MAKRMTEEYFWDVEVKGGPPSASGPGSGHHGHRGRPGQQGGSLPSSAGLTSGGAVLREPSLEFMPDMSVVGDRVTVLGYSDEFSKIAGLSEEDLMRLAYVKGYPASVQCGTPFLGATRDDDRISVTVSWAEETFDPNWPEMGEATIILGKNPGGQQYAQLVYMRLQEKYQGGGMAKKLYRKQLMFLAASGYDYAVVEADISIGIYAWARQGMEYDPRQARDHIFENITTQRGIKEWLRVKGLGRFVDQVPKFNSVQDVANWDPGFIVKGSEIDSYGEVPEDMEMHLGKAYMLDRNDYGHDSWYGRINFK